MTHDMVQKAFIGFQLRWKSVLVVLGWVVDGTLMLVLALSPKSAARGPPLAKAWISLGQTVPT